MTRTAKRPAKRKTPLKERARAYCLRHGQGCQSTVIPPWLAGYRAAMRDAKRSKK